jgi:hypothetical protein
MNSLIKYVLESFGTRGVGLADKGELFKELWQLSLADACKFHPKPFICFEDGQDLF